MRPDTVIMVIVALLLMYGLYLAFKSQKSLADLNTA